ncbi:MAG: FKBP-type peptidyl-prolyl cis-trans isomerase [Parafilimonas sp.]|nr:FKBP-type peptidyl-prolyl cis-trans isomerase [Parafilimonas sp.]
MKRTIAVLLAISFFACNMNYEKTPSGLSYKIIHGKGGAKPKPGEFVKFNMEYRLADRDSVLQSTYNSLPAYDAVDTSKRAQYSVREIMPLLSVGDSAIISISIDSLKNKGLIPDYTPVLVKGQVLTAKIKLLNIFKDEKDVVADYNKTMENEKTNEIKVLEQYMAKNNLKGTKTKNGAYVIIDNPGDASNKADSGKMATVMYRGYLVSNGKVFDTNMDTTKGHTDPYKIVVGTQGSIQGFSEGLPYFGKGGKGKILIPAMLGYGPQAMGPDLPAFSNLVFDIDVVDVGDAPPQQNNAMLQQQIQEQLQKMKAKQDSTQKH